MAKSKARFLSELLGSTGLVKKSKSALAGADEVLDLDTIPTIPNSKLQNSSISVAGHSTALGGSVSLNTGNISEHTNYKYFTEARARGAVSVSGDLAYNSSTGVISFTERTNAEVRGLVSAGGNLSYNSSTGVFSYTTPTTIASLSNHDTADLAEGTNLYFTNARADARIAAASTSDLSEGTNLYYTDARADARIAAADTGDLSEGSNLYYTNARADARIAAATTDDLSEGSSNLYYTDARADARVALIVDSAPGTLNTLNELAAALGDDANFSTTVTNSIATKLPLAGGALTGAVTTNSTFDGRNVSVDGAKLDGIETGATADQTAAEILTAIKTVDGSGSGLDADLLDGLNSTSFLRSDAQATSSNSLIIAEDWGSDTYNSQFVIQGSYPSWETRGNSSQNYGWLHHQDSSGNYTLYSIAGYTSNSWTQRFTFKHSDSTLRNGGPSGNVYYHQGNDASGSGLDADLLDGVQGSSYLRSDANDSYAGILTVNGMNFMNDSNTARNFKMKTNDSSTTDVGLSLYTGANAHAVQLYGVSTQYGFLDGNWAAWDIRKTKNGNFEVDEGSGLQRVWNAGNDGSGSGLDADLLDGQHGSYYFSAANFPTQTNFENVYNNLSTSTGSGADLNSTFLNDRSGTFDCWSGSNLPPGTSHVQGLQVRHSTGSDYGWQLASQYNQPGKMYVRNVSNGTFYGWQKIWTDGNDGSGTGLDADLLDGQHGSYYATASGLTSTTTTANAALPKAGGTMTGTITSRDILLGNSYHLMRSNHHSGHLEGSYNNVGENSYKSNPIYTIGSNYNPSDATLGNMYGVGYGHTNASFISMTGASGWGMYVAADGDARIYLSGSNGVISSTGQHYVGSSVVWNAGNDGSGTGLDADLLDGQQGSYYQAALGTSARWPIAYISGQGANSYDKLRVWDDSNYAIGMYSGQTYGWLNDYAMTFQMNNDSDRGFVWRHSAMAASDGAMSLTTGGNLSVKNAISFGGSTSYYMHTGSWGWRHQTPSGYIEFGPANTSHAHIYTDGPNFYFNKQLLVLGNTVWNAGNDGSGSGLDADLLDGNHASAFALLGGSNHGRTIPNRWFATADADNNIDFYTHNYAKAQLGNTYKYSTSRPAITSDSNYWVGSMGWGQIDLNTILSYGSGFWDSWGTPANRPSTYTSHWNGLNSLHYSASSTYHHGMQMAMGAGNPAHTYLRGWWASGGSGYGWQKIWTDGNDGSGSGLDADLLDGLNSSSFLRSDADDTSTGILTVSQLKVGDGNDGVFFSDSNGRTAFASGDFYIQGSVGNCYIYATNTYLGAGSGDSIYLRGNTMSGNSWSLTGAGAFTTSGTMSGSGWSLTAAGAFTTSGVVDINGGHGGLNITSSSILSAPTSTWTGNPGAAGKIQYHSNRWYIVSDSSSALVVQFRRDGSDVSRIENDGSFSGPYVILSSQTAYTAPNYGHGIFGVYSSYRYQHVWSMGTAYKTSADGQSYGNMYGITWTHTNVGTGTNQSISGLSHQWQLRMNGTLYAAIGAGIWTSGNVTAYSDIAVKRNLVKIPNALEKVCSINGYTFERTDYVKDPDDANAPDIMRQAGVVAQEIEKVLPEVVSGNEGNKAVAYGNIVALLIEAIKEQQNQIEELKEIINGSNL